MPAAVLIGVGDEVQVHDGDMATYAFTTLPDLELTLPAGTQVGDVGVVVLSMAFDLDYQRVLDGVQSADGWRPLGTADNDTIVGWLSTSRGFAHNEVLSTFDPGGLVDQWRFAVVRLLPFTVVETTSFPYQLEVLTTRPLKLRGDVVWQSTSIHPGNTGSYRFYAASARPIVYRNAIAQNPSFAMVEYSNERVGGTLIGDSRSPYTSSPTPAHRLGDEFNTPGDGTATLVGPSTAADAKSAGVYFGVASTWGGDGPGLVTANGFEIVATGGTLYPPVDPDDPDQHSISTRWALAHRIEPVDTDEIVVGPTWSVPDGGAGATNGFRYKTVPVPTAEPLTFVGEIGAPFVGG
jgi:hypothetical protein